MEPSLLQAEQPSSLSLASQATCSSSRVILVALHPGRFGQLGFVGVALVSDDVLYLFVTNLVG